MAFTHAQLAKRFGVSAATISYWKSKGCPVRSTFAAIDAWRQDFEATNPRKQGPAADPQIARLKKALLAAELSDRLAAGEIKKLKQAAMERSLVPIAEAKELIGNIVDQARTRAMNLPKTHAKKFVGLADVAAAEAAIESLVRDLAAVFQSAVEDL